MLVIATLIILVTAVNLWSDNISLLSKLPESRVEQARKEALSRPFLQREHRIERRPRLESAGAVLLSVATAMLHDCATGLVQNVTCCRCGAQQWRSKQ